MSLLIVFDEIVQVRIKIRRICVSPLAFGPGLRILVAADIISAMTISISGLNSDARWIGKSVSRLWPLDGGHAP